ncbi:hypothetical protein V8E36_004546 [Tilletia maclaganii]
MFVYSLAGKIGSVSPFGRRKQEEEESNRQIALQQAVELELSKQHIASAVTILSDAFLESSQKQNNSRPATPSYEETPSGMTTPTANDSPSSGCFRGSVRTLRRAGSNPLLRLTPASPGSSGVVSTTTGASQSNLVPTQNYSFAPRVAGGGAPASLSNSMLADQYIQSVHFLLSALSPTQASQLPELSRRQMRMSLSQAIDRLDLATSIPSTEQERSSFWTMRSQVTALDRLLRSGESRVSSRTPANNTNPQAPLPYGYPMSTSYPSPMLEQQASSRPSKRERAVEIAVLPAHLAVNAASQAFSAMILCAQLAFGIAIPILWLMLRVSPINQLRAGKTTNRDAQYQQNNESSSGLNSIQQTARNAATQVIDFANSPLGMYANAMFAKHAPNAHSRANAVWSFAQEQLVTPVAGGDHRLAWPTHSDSCPAGMSQHEPLAEASRSMSTSTCSSQGTLVSSSPWPSLAPGQCPSDLENSADSKYLTWPRQPFSPRMRAISAPDNGGAQGSEAGVLFPAQNNSGRAEIAVPGVPTASSPARAEVMPVNKRRWSSLIGRGPAHSNPAPPARPPLPESMTVQRQQSGHGHPARALSVSTGPSTGLQVGEPRSKHSRQHSWAPSASSSMVVSRPDGSKPTGAVVPHTSGALASASIPAPAPTFPDVLNSLSVQTSRALSDPANSYSVYSLVPGAGVRRSIRKNASRSMRHAIFWARTNGVLRAGVDAVCVGLEAALAGVEAWGDSEFERQEGDGAGGLPPANTFLQLEAAKAAPCSCGQIHPVSAATGSAAAQHNMANEEAAVDVPHLNFAFNPDGPLTLRDCNIQLPRGSRCLLIGANGAGKSTLLRIMAGKRLASQSNIRVFGRDVFRDAPRGITYLGTEWAMNPVVRSDIVVSHFLDSVGSYRHKERRDHLLDILDVDLDWRMHAISDGERRRVQLCMGLMEPWDLLLLDEVTVDLDVQVRADLLNFLAEETVKRNATILYATHIFDGLQAFPTHIVHMRLGTTVDPKPLPWPPSEAKASDYPQIQPNTSGVIERDLSPLLTVALAWLREDRKIRQEKEKEESSAGDAHALSRMRKRGARLGQETTDSEAFFSKYDYGAGTTR